MIIAADLPAVADDLEEIGLAVAVGILDAPSARDAPTLNASPLPEKLLYDPAAAVLEAHRHEQLLLAGTRAGARAFTRLDAQCPFTADAKFAVADALDLVGDGGAEPQTL